MFIRFNELRKEQEKFAKDCLKTIEERNVLIANAPTGLGKTDAVLASALFHAFENNLNVIFSTPKISQHKLAIEIINEINKKYKTNFVVTDLIGKMHMCSNENAKAKDNSAFYRICENLCQKNLCEYYLNVIDENMLKLKTNNFKKIPLNKDAFEIINYSKENGFCAYELNLRNLKYSNIIICDFNHVFFPEIFNYILMKSSIRKRNSILIVDEAHNLYDRLSNKLSKKIGVKIIKKAYLELKKFQSYDEQDCLKKELKLFYKDYVKKCKFYLENDEETIVSQEFFNFIDKYDDLLDNLSQIGLELTLKMNKTSNVQKLANFIANWPSNNVEEETKFARILEKKNFKLAKYCLDVRDLSSVINHFYSAILMSGSLNVDMTEELLGIEKAVKKNYEYPFSLENRLVIKINGITSKYSQRNKEMYSKIAKTISQIHSKINSKIVCYFPSFEFLEEVKKFMPSDKIVLYQKNKMKPKEIKEIKELFNTIGDILFCVQGGSLAEGIEFKNNMVKGIIIVGLPLNKMNALTKAKIQYFQQVFNKGLEYAYIIPAINKIIQASGRLIRNESDFGIIVFLEDRISQRQFSKYLPQHLNFIEIDNYEKVIEKFIEYKKKEITMLYKPEEFFEYKKEN
ncbi:MAG: ATP-dependent DNA helicase [Candidatus Anstonellales archaeon]